MAGLPVLEKQARLNVLRQHIARDADGDGPLIADKGLLYMPD